MGQQFTRAGSAFSSLLILGPNTGPSTKKDSGHGGSISMGLMWGFSSMQGWRDRMEDAHLALQYIPGPWRRDRIWHDTPTFGVFDGHGGEHAAKFCQGRMPSEIAKCPGRDVASALDTAFHRMDQMLADAGCLPELNSLSNEGATPLRVHPSGVGCTALVCCVCPHEIVVANTGDSRAVLCRQGRAINMSEDHKPNLPRERLRIENAGGCVTKQPNGPYTIYRVNGDLSLSRSIGDLRFKQNIERQPWEQMVCCTPDIRVFEREPSDEFMILACDGIWDVLESQQVVNYIRPALGRLRDGTLRPEVIIEKLLDDCLSSDPSRDWGTGCDNMTVVLVVFNGSVAQVRRGPLGQVAYHEIGLPGLPNWLLCRDDRCSNMHACQRQLLSREMPKPEPVHLMR